MCVENIDRKVIPNIFWWKRAQEFNFFFLQEQDRGDENFSDKNQNLEHVKCYSMSLSTT